MCMFQAYYQVRASCLQVKCLQVKYQRKALGTPSRMRTTFENLQRSIYAYAGMNIKWYTITQWHDFIQINTLLNQSWSAYIQDFKNPSSFWVFTHWWCTPWKLKPYQPHPNNSAAICAKRTKKTTIMLPASGMESRYAVAHPFIMRNLSTSWLLLATPDETRRVHRLTGRGAALKQNHERPLCSTQASRSSREAALTSSCTKLLRRRISQLSKSANCSSCGSRLSSIDRPHVISKSQTCRATGNLYYTAGLA